MPNWWRSEFAQRTAPVAEAQLGQWPIAPGILTLGAINPAAFDHLKPKQLPQLTAPAPAT